MSMFCFQCQEAAGCKGCTVKGMCGKEASTAGMQDLLIHMLKGLAVLSEKNYDVRVGHTIIEGLFATITNANFDDDRFHTMIFDAIKLRDELKVKVSDYCDCDCLSFDPESITDLETQAAKVSILNVSPNEDVRSLRELLLYGMKGVAAYAHHAMVQGYEDESIYKFLVKGLASMTKELEVDQMVGLVLECGEIAVTTMALLDKANTSTYGNPEITEVNLGVGDRPGILVSGHDLKDMKQLLEETKNAGIDIYTHSEMLPTHYYPEFKKYTHLKGNYGGSWWHQNKEFASFNGPILMTTNCITPVQEEYKDRIFTTGVVGYKGVQHIPERDGKKDFSQVIELAKTCKAPTQLETGKIVGGFAHNQVLALADKVVAAVKSGAIKKFVVMAGCDGRQKGRNYFTEVAEKLPKDTVILTAGCAKYRYNKLNLGDIGGIPRVLDAGQCNDSYSLAVIALKLKEVFGLEDINELPIAYDIAWYEQKAVAVLLALLHLGVKNIRLGPTLPAFLSPNVAKVLVENFNIMPIGNSDEDVAKIMG